MSLSIAWWYVLPALQCPTALTSRSWDGLEAIAKLAPAATAPATTEITITDKTLFIAGSPSLVLGLPIPGFERPILRTRGEKRALERELESNARAVDLQMRS